MPRYLKTKLDTSSTKKTSSSKSSRNTSPKPKKTKKLTKTRVREILHFRRLVSHILMLFSVVVELFNIALIINGGWDDISLLLFVGAPLLAFLSMCVSYDNRKRYYAIKRDFWIGLILLVVTGGIFSVEVLYSQIAPFAIKKVEDSDQFMFGQYNCANNEKDRDSRKFTVKIYLNDKEFGIADYDDPGDIVVGSYGVFDAGENMRRLKAIIKENDAKDSSRGFDETSYLFEFQDSVNVKVTSESKYITRYCKRV